MREERAICDACGDAISTNKTAVYGRLVMRAGDQDVGMGGMDLCPGCVAGVRRFLDDYRTRPKEDVKAAAPSSALRDAQAAGSHEPRETQQSVSAWAEATFGPAASNMSCAARANVEMAELFTALAADDENPKARIECADIVIVLYRLCERNGWDLHAAIDEKMATNRKRKWTMDGNGHGQHVEEELDFDAVKRALLDEEPDAPVFKPGKPIKPIEMKEPDIAQVSRSTSSNEVADLRLRNSRLECEVARLEGVIEGMRVKL